MIYNSSEELLEALGKLPKGIARAEILAIPQNRNLIKSSGANVTFYCGELKDGATVKEQLSNVRLGLIVRTNSRSGIFDGMGAFGGLSERITAAKFDTMSEPEKFAAAESYDDIIISEGKPVLTTDIDVIRTRNVMREMREELGNLGIYDYNLNVSSMTLIPMPEIKDDNYIINIWNGQGQAWAITPYCHTLKVREKILDNLVERSQDIKRHEAHSEAASFIKIPLFQALKSYGNFSGTNKLEDGRNATSDYRYPHEWLAAWYIASQILQNDDNSMIKLMNELQSETPYKISFKQAAKKMGKDLDFIASTLNLKLKTVESMEQTPIKLLRDIQHHQYR